MAMVRVVSTSITGVRSVILIWRWNPSAEKLSTTRTSNHCGPWIIYGRTTVGATIRQKKEFWFPENAIDNSFLPTFSRLSIKNTEMESVLPDCCIDLIMDYHAQLEHTELYTDCMVEMRNKRLLKKYRRMLNYYYIMEPLLESLRIAFLHALWTGPCAQMCIHNCIILPSRNYFGGPLRPVVNASFPLLRYSVKAENRFLPKIDAFLPKRSLHTPVFAGKILFYRRF